MDSALLREKIELYRLVVSETDYGTIKESYEYKCSTRAHVLFDGQSRQVSEGEVYFPTDRTLVVRHYVPVDERDRIKWQDKWWRIISINPNRYHNDKEIRIVEINE